MRRVICGRCQQGFGSQGELDTHLRVKDLNEMCALKEAEAVGASDDVEEGIGLEVSNRLRDRTVRRQILDWSSLWTALFPRDLVIPDSGKPSTVQSVAMPGTIGLPLLAEFNPVIELDEVKTAFEEQLVAFRALVYDKFRMASDRHDNTANAENLALIAGDMIQQYFIQIIQGCQNTFGSVSNPQRHEERRHHPQPRLLAPSSAPHFHPILPSDTDYSNTPYAPTDSSVSSGSNLKRLASKSITMPPIVNSQKPAPFVLDEAIGKDNPTSHNIVRETEGLGDGDSADGLPTGNPAESNPCPECLQPCLGACLCSWDWNKFKDFDFDAPL